MKQDPKIKKNMRSLLKIHTNEVVEMKEFIIFILDIFTGGWIGYFFERKENKVNNETKESQILEEKINSRKIKNNEQINIVLRERILNLIKRFMGLGVLNEKSQISNVKIEGNYICIEFSNHEKLEVYFSSLDKIENIKINNCFISKVQWEDLIDNPMRKRD